MTDFADAARQTTRALRRAAGDVWMGSLSGVAITSTAGPWNGAAFESIALAMAELAMKDAASHPDAQRVVSLVERLTGEDAKIIARRLKDRLRR